MLLNFPIPGDDELLYSVIARYSELVKFPSLKTVGRQAFGATTAVATIEFPARLNALAGGLQSSHPCASPVTLIAEHTLFRWYAPFLPADRRERLRTAMLTNGGAATWALAGIQASGVRAPSCLRYCPECFQEDFKSGKSLYWRRLHQLTGIEICPRHYVFLENSEFWRCGRTTRHIYECAEKHLLNVPARSLVPRDSILIRVSRLGQALLGGEWPSIGLDTLHENVLRLLGGAGFLTLRESVRLRHLVEQINNAYSREYLMRVNGSESPSWIHRLIHKPRAVQAPIRYLLMLAFLDAELKSLFERQCTVETPEAPPCENAVCPHKGLRMAYERAVTSPDVGGKVLHHRCPSCGRLLARSLAGKHSSWIVDYGDVWRSELMRKWNHPNWSLRQIAVLLGVDPMTVKRQAVKLGLAFPRAAVRPTTLRGLEPMLRPKHDRLPELKLQWLRAKQANPALGPKEFRSQFGALYAALYRRDPVWLRQNQPLKKKNDSKARVDWVSRDEKLQAEINSDALARQRRSRWPRRITRTGLMRAAGAESWMPKMARLPKTKRRLEELAESRIDFACRKLREITEQHVRDGRELKEWQLWRVGALRDDLLKYPQFRVALALSLERLQMTACRN